MEGVLEHILLTTVGKVALLMKSKDLNKIS